MGECELIPLGVMVGSHMWFGWLQGQEIKGRVKLKKDSDMIKLKEDP